MLPRNPEVLFTFTGKMFNPTHPDPETICIEDIAHGLSQMCRYSGQSPSYYSVAEHSVLMAYYVKKEMSTNHPLAFACLMHDATEAYLNDIGKCLKYLLPKYIEWETHLDSLIKEKFAIQHFDEVKLYDLMILKTEIHDFFGMIDIEFLEHIEFLPVHFRHWPPEIAKTRFLEAYEKFKS